MKLQVGDKIRSLIECRHFGFHAEGVIEEVLESLSVYKVKWLKGRYLDGVWWVSDSEVELVKEK